MSGMRNLLLVVLLHLLASFSFGKDAIIGDLKYQPKNLDEAISQLAMMHHDTLKQKIRSLTEDEFIGQSHFGLGMWIRNNWGLWKGGDLSKYFNSIGIKHPDDMSGVILVSYYRRLKGVDVNLKEQIQAYQDYWKKLPCPSPESF